MLSKSSEYSEKELALIRYYRMEILTETVRPIMLYNAMVYTAFVKDDRSCYAESLRRCILALEGNTIRRMTPEFDALIDI